MKEGTKDKIKGLATEVKGEVRQALGYAIQRPDLVKDGKKQRAAGRLQRRVDDSKQPKFDA
jgi:uncharacterized protein YjbJ (UPF0337 family)